VRQAGSHIEPTEPNRTIDDQEHTESNESQLKPTSLVDSYSSSSEDEETESSTEAKRTKLDSPTQKLGDTTKTDKSDERIQPSMNSLSAEITGDTTRIDNDERLQPYVKSTEFEANTSENEKESKVETRKSFEKVYDLFQETEKNEKNLDYNSDSDKNNVSTPSKEHSNQKEIEGEARGTHDILESVHTTNTAWPSNVSTDDEDEYVQDPTSSWYQADKGGIKPRDFLGRDSSSEDEEYDFYDMDQQTGAKENDFVYISEIDFSMFP
jgi:hypothetical protein